MINLTELRVGNFIKNEKELKFKGENEGERV